MKKFLKIGLPLSAREIPPETDALILAAAAMRARAVRRKNFIFKVMFPGVAAAAAAAVTAVTVLPQMTETGTVISKNAHYHAADAVQAEPEAEITAVAPAELLALADTTELEQESYNLATMTDFYLDVDSLTI